MLGRGKPDRAPAIAVAPGTTEAAAVHIQSASERLRLAQRQLADAKREIALPGVGQTVLATLLAEAPQALAHQDYKALRCMSRVAPVTRRSGKHKLIVRRMSGHAHLRHTVYHWARGAVQRDAVSKAKYAALRGRGHGHARGRLRHGVRTQTCYRPPCPAEENAA